MERVLGVGDIFFKAKDPKKLKAWYREESYGKLGWVTDPEGNRSELWEAPSEG